MGSKSTTRASETQNDFTFNNVDNREGAGGGVQGGNINLNLANTSIGSGGSGGDDEGGAGSGAINITQTDLGAISGALGFGGQALDFAGDALGSSLTTVLDANERATENAALIVNRGLEFASQENRSENERLLEGLGRGAGYLLAAGLIGTYILKKA